MVDTNSLNYFINFDKKPLMSSDLVAKNIDKQMTFVICFGLQGSGKTTFCTNLQQLLNQEKINCGTFSRDMLRYLDNGTYCYIEEREPLIQNAHLELLYQLSEERNYDVVIIDDANLKYEQVISTFLAIDHYSNDIILVNFEPFSVYRHMDRIHQNGHLMSMEKMIFMKKLYFETWDKIKDLPLRKIVVEAPKESFDEDYDSHCMQNIKVALDKTLERIKDPRKVNFSMLGITHLFSSSIKREIFEKYKKTFENPTTTSEAPAEKKQKGIKKIIYIKKEVPKEDESENESKSDEEEDVLAEDSQGGDDEEENYVCPEQKQNF